MFKMLNETEDSTFELIRILIIIKPTEFSTMQRSNSEN